MAAGWPRQFRTKIWSILVAKRKAILETVLEFLLPIVLLCVLIVFKNTAGESHYAAGSWAPDAVETPSMGDLLGGPSSESSNFYTSHMKQFLEHGGSNMLYECNPNQVTECLKLKMVVIPNDQSDAGLKNLADTLSTYWTGKYPELANSSWFETSIKDSRDLNSYVSDSSYGTASKPKIGAAIVFLQGSPSFRYQIRLNFSSAIANPYGSTSNIPHTLKKATFTADAQRGATNFTAQYLFSGFLTLQQEVDNFILSSTLGVPTNIKASSFALPTNSFTEYRMFSQFNSHNYVIVLQLLTVLMIALPGVTMLRRLVSGKRFENLTIMLGMRPSVNYCAWYLYVVAFSVVFGLVLSLVAKLALFKFTSWSILFVFYFVCCYSNMGLAHFISGLARNTPIAITIFMVLTVLAFLTVQSPAENMQYEMVTYSFYYIGYYAAGTLQAIAEFEAWGTPLTWSVITQSPDHWLSPLSFMAFQFGFGTLLFWLGALADGAVPIIKGSQTRHRLQSPIIGLFRTLGKLICSKNKGPQNEFESIVNKQLVLESRRVVENELFEELPKEKMEEVVEGNGVVLQNISKVFGKYNRKAVHNLTMTLLENQITVLLGPNGAGKSTTFQILNGLLSATAGEAYIYGKSTKSKDEMLDIRQHLGVCPQENVLIPNFTVREHIVLFEGIKGEDVATEDERIEALVEQVGLFDKLHTPSSALSGGMKRRLQLAIALCGGSKFIIIDEVTSGVDPKSRALIQETVLKFREGRTILMSTHYLEEADLLGDRIGILANGSLQAMGTSLFLKKNTGIGYEMAIKLETEVKSPEEIVSIVQSKVPSAALSSTCGKELLMKLPLDASGFSEMLRILDDSKTSLGIKTVDLKASSLGSAFLAVADQAEKSYLKASTRVSDLHSASVRIESKLLPSMIGDKSLRSQTKWLIRKRFLILKRNKCTWFCQLFLPLLFAILALVAALTAKTTLDLEAVVFNADSHWNSGSGNGVPIPSTIGDGLSVNNASTNKWITSLEVNDKDIGLRALVGPTGTYCIDKAYVAENVQFLTDHGVSSDLISLAASTPTCGAADVYPLTTAAFSEFLKTSRDPTGASTYGALLFGVLPDNFETGTVPTNVTAEYTVAFNYTGIHAAPLLANRANGALLSAYKPGYSITTESLAFQVTEEQEQLGETFSGIGIALAIVLGTAFLTSSFSEFIVREKQSKAWHQQLLNGISDRAYWISNWMYDYTTFMLYVVLVFAIAAAMQLQGIGENFGALMVISFVAGLAIASFIYFTTFFFTDAGYAHLGGVAVSLLFGLLLVVVTWSLKFNEGTREVAEILEYVFGLVPIYAFAYGCANAVSLDLWQIVYNTKAFGGDPSNPTHFTTFSWKVAGKSLAMLGIDAVLYTLLLLWFQLRFRDGVFRWRTLFCCSPKPRNNVDQVDVVYNPVKQQLDSTVHEETIRVASGVDDAITIRNVSKVYAGGHAAVKSISLGIPEGECFGFLGCNGAGKTSTMSMVAGDLPITSGTITVGGFDVSTNTAEAQNNLGYCPQFDALFDYLTVEEHLVFYATMQGFEDEFLARVVDAKVRDLDLEKHRTKKARELSGGNKRKLSVAIATIGFPKAVVLDEPSSGMDIGTMRSLRAYIVKLRQSAGVMLSSHSMSEVSACSTRIGILTSGRFRALGSANQLIDKFGEGWLLEIILDEMDSVSMKQAADRVTAFLEENLPGASLSDFHSKRLRYKLPTNATPIHEMFDILQSNKQQLEISSYSLGPETLEDIFIKFA